MQNSSFLIQDDDKGGSLDHDELTVMITKHLGLKLQQAEIEDAVTTMDADCGGSVNFNEFYNWWTMVAICIQIDEIFITIDGFCIQNDGLCIQIDDLNANGKDETQATFSKATKRSKHTNIVDLSSPCMF